MAEGQGELRGGTSRNLYPGEVPSLTEERIVPFPRLAPIVAPGRRQIREDLRRLCDRAFFAVHPKATAIYRCDPTDYASREDGTSIANINKRYRTRNRKSRRKFGQSEILTSSRRKRTEEGRPQPLLHHHSPKSRPSSSLAPPWPPNGSRDLCRFLGEFYQDSARAWRHHVR